MLFLTVFITKSINVRKLAIGIKYKYRKQFEEG